MSTARFIVGDTREIVASLPDASVDLVLTSPPFLALRSYLPSDDPNKALEIGQEANPAAFLDVLLELTAGWRRVLAPHGSIAIELGDTYSGSGGAGGDYADGGLRDGQQSFDGSGRKTRKMASREHRPEGAAHRGVNDFAEMVVAANGGRGWPLAKSLALVPELYRVALAYGINPLTGQPSPAGRWRVRNVVRWHRPNPPVGALGDKFRPSTSDMVIACVSDRRWFDLDAVREEAKPHSVKYGDAETRARHKADGYKVDTRADGGRMTHGLNPAGAPPLDTWVIPTHPYEAETVRRFRVPLDAAGDGIRRTTSPDCPVHGSTGHPGSSDPGDGRADSGSIRTERTDGRPGQERTAGSVPTFATLGLWDSTTAPSDPECAPVATTHSNGTRRTVPVPATTSPGTPSARTVPHTGGTPAEPASSAPHHGMDESSTTSVCPDAAELGSQLRNVDTSDPSSACSCSFYVDVEIPSPEDTGDYATWPTDTWVIPTHPFSGAHYATWPPALCVKPIKSMCPERVCTTCGEPSRRRLEHLGERRRLNPPQLEDFSFALEKAMRRAHLTHHDVAKHLGFDEAAVRHWLGKTGAVNHRLPSVDVWDELVTLLPFDGDIRERMETVDPDYETVDRGNRHVKGRLSGGAAAGDKPKVVPTGWTDCGCSTDGTHWRAGVVLDPFGGSGTTGMVATGLGRDAILIDLDARNLDLARDRIGMFLEAS